MWPERNIRAAANAREFARLRAQLAEQRRYAEAGAWVARQPIRTVVSGYGKDDAKAVLNIVHPIGKGLLSAFGAGSIADAAENLEVKYGVLDAPKQPAPQKSAAASQPFAQPQGKLPGAASTSTTQQPQPQLQLQPGAISWMARHPLATLGIGGAALFLLTRIIR